MGPGLGTAVVSLLAAAGATVIAVARNRSPLDPLEKHAKIRGWDLRTATADVSLQAGATEVVERAVSEFGRLDGVSIHVGKWIVGDTLLHRTTEEEWSAGLHGNLDAIHRLGRAALPAMLKQRRGSVVLVSATEHIRRGASPSYCVAKAGILDLTLKLAADYRPYGIRVNAVLPGNMGYHVDPMDPPDAGNPIPLRTDVDGAPWSVARAIRYLLLDDSEWVTGALLTADGGQSTVGAEPPT